MVAFGVTFVDFFSVHRHFLLLFVLSSLKSERFMCIFTVIKNCLLLLRVYACT